MGQGSRPAKRIFAATAAVLITAALLTGLFHEARAVTIDVDDTGTVSTSTVKIGITVTIPKDQRLPIDNLVAVVEETSSSTKSDPTVVAKDRCDDGDGCTDATGDALPDLTELATGSKSAAITKIELDTIGAAGTTIAGYGYGNLRVDVSGYGHNASFGYGYEEGGGGIQTDGYGYGYGYQGADQMRMFYNVTLDASTLGNGHYWLTFLVETGSSTIGTLSSADEHFQVSISTSGGGSTGGSSGSDGGDGGDGPETIEAGMGDAFDADNGDTIDVTSDLPTGITSLKATLNQDCDDCSIHVERRTTGPKDGSGASDIPAGWTGVTFLTIELRDSSGDAIASGVSSGTISFEVDQSDLPAGATAKQIVLLRFDDAWTPLDTSLTSDSSTDPLTYEATLPGFSEFAITTDDEAPTVSGGAPTGVVQQVTPEVSATFSDNRGIDTAGFTLIIDGQTHDDTTGDLTVTSSGFTYVPGTALDTSEHTIEVTIKDTSGNTGTGSWSFTITAPPCPTPPRILVVDPVDGADGVKPGTQISATLELGSCEVTNATMTFNGATAATRVTNGTVMATLPTSIGFGFNVDATLTVEDTGGNKASKSWSFTTAQEQAEAPGDQEDQDGADQVDQGGVPGWLWAVLILLALAVVGAAGWYYYEELK